MPGFITVMGWFCSFRQEKAAMLMPQLALNNAGFEPVINPGCFFDPHLFHACPAPLSSGTMV